MNNSGAVPLIGQSEPENQAPESISLQTAYVIFVDHLGRVGFSPDPDLLADSITMNRLATPDDMYGAAANVMRQLAAQFTAVETHQFMISQAHAAAQAAENAKIAAMVNHSGRN